MQLDVCLSSFLVAGGPRSEAMCRLSLAERFSTITTLKQATQHPPPPPFPPYILRPVECSIQTNLLDNY